MSVPERLRRAVRSHGFAGAARRATEELFKRGRRDLRNVRERLYDRRLSIDTAGVEKRAVLEPWLPDDARHYQATAPAVFARLIRSVPLDPSRYTFVDLGSGKGRTLVMASELGFRAVVGVEVSPRLHRAAEGNIRRFEQAGRGRDRSPTQFSLVLGDASRYEIPLGRVLIYLYNPFGEETMRKVAARIGQAASLSGSELFVIYYNPTRASPLESLPDLVQLSRDKDFVSYRSSGGVAGVGKMSFGLRSTDPSGWTP